MTQTLVKPRLKPLLKLGLGALLLTTLPALANTVNYQALNPKNALVFKSGKGSIKFSVITDPNCGYCRKLEQNLARIDNITVNKYLVNYFGSSDNSQNIWCSKNRNQAFLNLMQYNIQPPTRAWCKTPMTSNMIVAKSFNMRGTPMIIKPNGEYIYGAPPVDELIAWLNK